MSLHSCITSATSVFLWFVDSPPLFSFPQILSNVYFTHYIHHPYPCHLNLPFAHAKPSLLYRIVKSWCQTTTTTTTNNGTYFNWIQHKCHDKFWLSLTHLRTIVDVFTYIPQIVAPTTFQCINWHIGYTIPQVHKWSTLNPWYTLSLCCGIL